MGRRKIEIKMVKDSNSRQVTFSKRRTGVFKKAYELATLCGAQVVIVVFSPGGKPFSFGNPDVESVTRRFLNQKEKPKLVTRRHGHVDSKLEAKLQKLNGELNSLLKQLQSEKKKGETLEHMHYVSGLKPKSLDEQSLDELLKIKKALEGLQDKLTRHLTEVEASSSLLLLSKTPVNEEER